MECLIFRGLLLFDRARRKMLSGNRRLLIRRGKRWNCVGFGGHSVLVILRPQGLDPLTHVAVINVAAVNFQEIAQGRRIIPRALK